eukprot:TRINITY_DN74972_c0_g1_i1.p1 TRINITY_DN74972_c0_g1~~TRINITY_DN74972_c0_g1_i1.p1  ORF type:complete len:419 (-),score=105.31 TRINITY_DN74972_c0_g1_i1:49-1305(-)
MSDAAFIDPRSNAAPRALLLVLLLLFSAQSSVAVAVASSSKRIQYQVIGDAAAWLKINKKQGRVEQHVEAHRVSAASSPGNKPVAAFGALALRADEGRAAASKTGGQISQVDLHSTPVNFTAAGYPGYTSYSSEQEASQAEEAADLSLGSCLQSASSAAEVASCVAVFSLALNVLLLPLACICGCRLLLAGDPEADDVDFMLLKDTVTTTSSQELPPPASEPDANEVVLAEVEALALRTLAGPAQKSASKSPQQWYKTHKLRFLAIAPALDINSDGSTLARLQSWRNGFLGWWETEDEFVDWCKVGRPPPKGSLGLATVVYCKLGDEGEGQVVVRHDGLSGSQQNDMVFAFESNKRALDWNAGLFALRELLGIPMPDKEPGPPGRKVVRFKKSAQKSKAPSREDVTSGAGSSVSGGEF